MYKPKKSEINGIGYLCCTEVNIVKGYQVGFGLSQYGWQKFEVMTFAINLRIVFTSLSNTTFCINDATKLFGFSVNRDTLGFHITRLVSGKCR